MAALQQEELAELPVVHLDDVEEASSSESQIAWLTGKLVRERETHARLLAKCETAPLLSFKDGRLRGSWSLLDIGLVAVMLAWTLWHVFVGPAPHTIASVACGLFVGLQIQKAVCNWSIRRLVSHKETEPQEIVLFEFATMAALFTKSEPLMAQISMTLSTTCVHVLQRVGKCFPALTDCTWCGIYETSMFALGLVVTAAFAFLAVGLFRQAAARTTSIWKTKGEGHVLLWLLAAQITMLASTLMCFSWYVGAGVNLAALAVMVVASYQRRALAEAATGAKQKTT